MHQVHHFVVPHKTRPPEPDRSRVLQYSTEQTATKPCVIQLPGPTMWFHENLKCDTFQVMLT